MKRYIALLRGINISGKNKIPMSELKEVLDNAPTWWGMIIKKYTTILYLSCRLCLVKMFVMKLGILRMSMRKYTVIKGLFSGHLFARIIERQTGGQGLRVRVWVKGLQLERQILWEKLLINDRIWRIKTMFHE